MKVQGSKNSYQITNPKDEKKVDKPVKKSIWNSDSDDEWN